MKIILISILFLGLYHVNQNQLIQNNPETEVSFKVKNMGIFVEGKFTEVLFESNFNKDDLNNSFINANIKVASLDTGNNKRDKDLMKSKYLDLNKFPEIKFTSTKIEKSEDYKYILTGDLTIKNTTKSIDIPFDLVSTEGKTMISSNFELNRRDYKVGGNSWIMSDKVIISVKYTLN